MIKIPRTSYSALSKFEECPLKYKLSYIDEINYAAGPAAAKGTRLHTACERFLKGEIEARQLSVDFMRIRPLLERMREMGAKAEEIWLIREDTWEFQGEETEETTFKAIVDIHWIEDDILHIRDLKTGRPGNSHYDQLEAYAVLGLRRYPEVKEVIVAPLYLEGEGAHTTYPRAIEPFLQKAWQGRWGKLYGAEQFPATPSNEACRWCPYKKSKGGECEWDF